MSIDNRLAIATQDIKNLRDLTSAGILEIKKALEEAKGDLEKAKKVLIKAGASKAIKRADKTASQGIVEAYSHNGKIGVLVEVNCETDFVARNDEFKTFTHDIALQIAAMKPENVSELLGQDYIKDPSQKVSDILNSLITKTGEKVVIKRFQIYILGE